MQARTAERVLTKDDVRQALSILDVRERLVFRMAVFNGMRPGEIFAIQLGKLSSNSLVVDQRIYGSHLDTPKGRKGRRTERLVALSPGTVRDLGLWRKFLGIARKVRFCSRRRLVKHRYAQTITGNGKQDPGLRR